METLLSKRRHEYTKIRDCLKGTNFNQIVRKGMREGPWDYPEEEFCPNRCFWISCFAYPYPFNKKKIERDGITPIPSVILFMSVKGDNTLKTKRYISHNNREFRENTKLALNELKSLFIPPENLIVNK